jgi:hypothetical protein
MNRKRIRPDPLSKAEIFESLSELVEAADRAACDVIGRLAQPPNLDCAGDTIPTSPFTPLLELH